MAKLDGRINGGIRLHPRALIGDSAVEWADQSVD